VAAQKLGSQVFVLDDGFQHLRLRRDLNIVTIDATRPWGLGHLLPWGRLREPRRELSRADCIVITRADQAERVAALREEIGGLVPNKPVFTSRMIVRGFRCIKTADRDMEERVAIARPVAAFCAIGNPASFTMQLQSVGYESVSTTVFSDHHRTPRPTSINLSGRQRSQALRV